MRYGPVPTGLRLAGASRDLAPLKGSKTCFGMIAPGDPQKTIGQNGSGFAKRSEEHTSELQSHSDLVCRLLLEKKKNKLYKRLKSIKDTMSNDNEKAESSGIYGA